MFAPLSLWYQPAVSMVSAAHTEHTEANEYRVETWIGMTFHFWLNLFETDWRISPGGSRLAVDLMWAYTL